MYENLLNSYILKIKYQKKKLKRNNSICDYNNNKKVPMSKLNKESEGTMH